MAIKNSMPYTVYRIPRNTEYGILNTKYSARSAGFTLIELMVVTAIIVIVTSLTLTNNAKFGGSVLLQNLAYDIALSIRQAQIYGISVHRFGASDFSSGYGMHFDSSSPASYVLFADAVAKNGLYDQDELVSSTDIRLGYHIADLCATSSGVGESCGLQKLDVLFKRPEPDAYIRTNGSSGLNESGKIVIESPRGDRMNIVVEATGQIAVQ